MDKTKTETESYCKGKLATLVRDHNHYKKVRYTAAVNDYRTAIDNLIAYAERQGIKMGYKVDEKGYLEVTA